MPQQTECAVLTRVMSVGESLVGRKLRLMGRLLSYESDTGLILLVEGDTAALIDVSLCVDRLSPSWIREHLSPILVVGHLEACSELAIPTIPRHARAPEVDARLVIRAVLVAPAADLEMDRWNVGIEEREVAGAPSSSSSSSTMCSTPTLASSSRHPVHIFWDPPVAQCYFPTSDLRSAHPPSRRSSIPPPHRVTPPQQESSCLHPTPSKHSNLLPRRKQIEPGVWSDGNDRVLSAACPSVQAFLKSARRIMSLPPAPNESVFALAALDVFYHIDDPAHWMFWNDDKKHNTADIVSRISLHRPQLIQSRVAWNGTPEYLFILSSLHGTSSLPVYENKDWYPILNPSKVPSPPRVINLRKRKVQHVEQSEPSESAELEDVESRPKRVKSISNPKRQPSPSGVSVDTNQTEMSQESPIGTSITSIEEDTEVVSSSSAALEGKQAPLYTRKRKRRGRQPSPQLYPMTTILQEPSPNAMSVLLTPAVGSHSRNRSISQASSQTIVSARDRRSVSVLSAITAVEILTPLRDELMKVDQITEESKEELGMVTRGRANKSRMVGQSKGGARRSVKHTKKKGGIK